MPTGYTYAVADGTVTDLRSFALICARAMGALAMMRDEPSDAEIPKQFEADTAYHDEKIAAARARLIELSTATKDELAAECDAYNQKVSGDRFERILENDAQRARYEAMIVQVEQWTGAPEGLKEFMIEQLYSSLRFDCSDEPTKYMEEQKALPKWLSDEFDRAQHDIWYHEKARDEELARIAGRNAWLAQLFASLPEEAAK